MKLSLFQTIFLAVFGVAALIGLFVFATYTSKNAGGGGIGAVLIWGTLPEEAMNATLAAATQVEPSLKNVTYDEKDEATLVAELASAIATGSPPDLVLASQEQLLSIAKFIVPLPFAALSARTFKSSFAENTNIFTAPGGAGYWGIPFLIDPLVLFYNRTILSTNGIAKPPASWEALTGLVPAVAQISPSRQITRGLIALGTYNNVHNARGILSTLFLQVAVPITGYSSTGILTADLGSSVESGVPPGQAVVRFYSQFADPSKVSYTWDASLPDSQSEFLSGDLALYLGYASEARFLKQANPNLDFDVAPSPQPATAQEKSVYGLAYAFMVPRGAGNSTGAYQAAALLSSTNEQAIAAQITGLAPVSLTELARNPADPTLAVAYAEALYSKSWLSPAPMQTDSVFSSMISNVISGRTTLETALSLAERSLNALLQ